MTDQAAAIPPNEAVELEVESHAPYLKVWFGLLVLTVIEYFYAKIFADHFSTLILGLLFWAFIKAGMVGWYFMHLKFEKPWVYIMIVPTLLLASILTLALFPDMALKFDEAEDEASTPQTSTAQVLSAAPALGVLTPHDQLAK
jgi:cytochrome c oxidase subunit 4